MNRTSSFSSQKVSIGNCFCRLLVAICGLFAASCARDKESANQENFTFPTGQGTNENYSSSQSCSNEEGCKLTITEVLQRPLASDADYSSRCQTLVDKQNQSQCSSPLKGISLPAGFTSKPSKTQCVFNAMNADGSMQNLKTIDITTGGGSIDVSALCKKTGVECKVSGNSCDGTVDIKIIDKDANALSAPQIAQICHAYIQPGTALPLKFSCSYGKTESSQTPVVSGTFAKISNNPTAETEKTQTPQNPQNPAPNKSTTGN